MRAKHKKGRPDRGRYEGPVMREELGVDTRPRPRTGSRPAPSFSKDPVAGPRSQRKRKARPRSLGSKKKGRG
jgi:hypothetical protein